MFIDEGIQIRRKNIMKTLGTILYLLLITGTMFSQKIYYVDYMLGTDLPNFGLNPGGEAWETIEYAINNVSNPEEDSIIIYLSNGTYDLNNNQIDIARNFKDLTLSGAGIDKTIIQSSPDTSSSSSRVIKVYINNKVSIKNLTIKNGNVFPPDNHGGGICNLGGKVILDYCKIDNNVGRADYWGVGGGIANIYGEMYISNSTISNNKTYNYCFGAGIGSINGLLHISNSTISSNLADDAAGIAVISDSSDALFNIENSTVYGNAARRIFGGIRISVFGYEPFENYIKTYINSCTIFNNTSSSYGYAGIGITGISESNNFEIKNTIVAGNKSNSNPDDLRGSDSSMTITSGGYNIFESVYNLKIIGEQSNGLGLDPKLLPLANNNSLNGTETCAIKEDSPARNMIPMDNCNESPKIDQRGYLRADDHDIGAYELSSISNITKSENKIPNNFILEQNYPNPFNPYTKINFSLPVSGYTKLSVYNLLGQEIQILIDNFLESGLHSLDFKADKLNSGIYFYKIESNGFTEIKKMTLLK